VPEGKAATEIYHVLCSALRSANKAGIGQISLYGHEQLCAVSALQNGMILEILRYPGELQDLPVLYTQPSPKVKSDYLALARQLIEKSAQPFDPSRYRDHYREALLELIEAKKEHRRPSFPAREKPEKVIDFMDALRRSLKENKKAKESSLPSKHTKPKSG
jgi:DNA end-binding protein Ku